jgi:hypothetical protein
MVGGARMMLLGTLFIALGIVVDGARRFRIRQAFGFPYHHGVQRWMDGVCVGIFGALAARLIVDEPVR